ncbi:MAG: hypothetical protein ABSA46_20480 [Thermodesulfovibrionales bacterium]|jgi:hypothetical protein
MKKLSARFIQASAIALMFLISSGCAGGTFLKTEPLQPDVKITGRYALVLLQDKNYSALKTIAFLDVEGNNYSLVPYAPAYEYAVTRDISGQEALQKAVAFVRDNPLSRSYQISRILDPGGTTIGYEVRPLYDPLDHGVSDVMTVSYVLRDKGIVQIHIDILQRVRNDFTD